MLFNSHGKSTGSAEIVFRRAEFANDAQAQYDGVLLDGFLSAYMHAYSLIV